MFNDRFTPMTGDNEPKCAPLVDVKEPGIYDLISDTVGILVETSRMLNLFANEIASDGQLCEEKCTANEPHSFKENVYQARALALGLRGDLDNLIRKFR